MLELLTSQVWTDKKFWGLLISLDLFSGRELSAVKTMEGNLLTLLVAPELASLVSRDTIAYVDPGTGSMLLQVIFGAIAVVGVAYASLKNRIASLFRRSSDVEKKKGPEQTNDAGRSG